MTAVRATRQQLAAAVEDALRGRLGDRAVDGGGLVLLVQADPTERPSLGPLGGQPIAVHGSSSPLEIRGLLQERPDYPIVVLTDADQSSLGDDLLARCVGRKVLRLNRWATLSQLFGAGTLSGALARRPHLIDALIEARPIDGYQKVTTHILDLDTATAALVRTYLGISDDITDLAGFLAWAARPDAAGRLASSRGALLDDLRPALRDRFGTGVDGVVAAMALDRPEDLVPLGLVAGVLHDPACDDLAARVRLDERLGRPGLDPDAYRRWGHAAEQRVASLDERAERTAAYRRAEILLDGVGGLAHAHLSDRLPTGFDQRVRQAAEALTAWRDDVDDPDRAGAAHKAVKRARRHDGAGTAGDGVDRLEMAARLIRRRSLSLQATADLSQAAASYVLDGAWLDAARVVVSRSDPDPVLASLCLALTVEADSCRLADGPEHARVAAHASRALPPRLLGVEDVVERVVAPLAATHPVLFVVLDGLSWPTFCDVVEELEAAGWSQWHRTDDFTSLGVAVAALPTVTEVSRTSLFAGELRTGDASSESRAFAGHRALTAAGPRDALPVVFHKSDQRAGGLDTFPMDIVDAVADVRRSVVGVVVNNIDERLKDVAQPPDGWKLRELDPLRHVLDRARQAGRVVVLTADHGHVLDRDAEDRSRQAGGGGGERWRPTGSPAAEGEIEVHGPRVVTGDHTAVLPWQEQLRYGPRRNGYHGGLTPQELFVPLVVLSAGEEVPGWSPTATRRPSWWHHTAQPPVTAPVRSRPPVLPAPEPAAPTLFDPPRSPEGSAAPDPMLAPAAGAHAIEGDWIDRLLADDEIVRRRRQPRQRLADDELRRLLTVLDAWGSMTLDDRRLAEEAALPPARIGRYVAQLQDLLNIDGYPVVTAVDGDIRFDRPLLERQLAP
jgi:hypothetical protein